MNKSTKLLVQMEFITQETGLNSSSILTGLQFKFAEALNPLLLTARWYSSQSL